MVSFFELLIVLLFLWLMYSNAGLKSRLKRLEDAQHTIRDRLALLEARKTGADAASLGEGGEAAATPAVGMPETAIAEDAPPAQEPVPAQAAEKAPTASGPPRAFVFTATLARQFV